MHLQKYLIIIGNGHSMELTVNQALEKGMSAQKKGKFKEAENFYRTILRIEPMNQAANYNMALLTSGTRRLQESIPFFRNALEINVSVPKFWLSYIDALVRLDRKAEAKIVIKRAKKKFGHDEKFDRFENKLGFKPKQLKNIVAMEEFYKSELPNIISSAALGWFFSDSFDRIFMNEKLLNYDNKNEKSPGEETVIESKIGKKKALFDAKKTIEFLNKEADTTKKYKILKKLLEENNHNLTEDSFGNDSGVDILYAQRRAFSDKSFNVVIIGAGVTGLFLANNIKYCLGEKINVLMLDNRSRKPNMRQPFDREWLTNVPKVFFQEYTPPNVRLLIESFGEDGFIGIPINVLEAILMLSCKQQGVDFFFSSRIHFSMLKDKRVDFFFDATGGRFLDCEYLFRNSEEGQVKVPYLNMNLKDTGTNQLFNTPQSEPGFLQVTLKAPDVFHRPYIGDTRIYTNMIKVTGIPAHFMKEILRFVKPLNHANLFYVWKGNLKTEINEGLVLINLSNYEYDILNSSIQSSVSLKLFLSIKSGSLNSIGKNIISLFKMLISLNENATIKIHKPFRYKPYINLNAGSGFLNGKHVFPIGDSLFCGNPKVGNGLGLHLKFINSLVRKMISVNNT